MSAWQIMPDFEEARFVDNSESANIISLTLKKDSKDFNARL